MPFKVPVYHDLHAPVVPARGISVYQGSPLKPSLPSLFVPA